MKAAQVGVFRQIGDLRLNIVCINRDVGAAFVWGIKANILKQFLQNGVQSSRTNILDGRVDFCR